MCYAIPGKLVEINGNIGVVDYYGEKRNCLLDIDAKVGDYVYAQGGVLISTIPEKEALEVIAFWKERFMELKETDKKLSKKTDNILPELQKANKGEELGYRELDKLMFSHGTNEIKLICETANNARQIENSNACCVHGIIEFSNICRNNCSYCGIRADSGVKRYRMTKDEILSVANRAVNELGFKAIVLQSGEDMWYTDSMLTDIVRELRRMDILIFLSIGLRKKETYRTLYEAGARAVLLRFETANKESFERLRPGTKWEERINLIKEIKKMGYLVATGFIVGLPDETEEDWIKGILLTKELGADMYSIGPLIPAEGTPLENEAKVSKEDMLKVIALSRLADRKCKILITTALETLDPSARKEGLMAGGNSLMLNLTPKAYKRLYRIYDGRPDEEIVKSIEETIELLYSIGRAPTDIGLAEKDRWIS